MNAKQWRLENAKLAKAYMAGGMPPFQAAQKVGFRNVPDMDAAIADAERAAAQPMPNRPEPNNQIGPNLIGQWENNLFTAKKFSATEEWPEMVRIWAGGRPSYIWFTPQDARKLLDVINNATGVLDNLYAEFQELRDERDEEAKAHLAELQRNEKLEQQLRKPTVEPSADMGVILSAADQDAELRAQNEALIEENSHLLEALRKHNETILKLKEKIADLVMAG